MNIINEICKLTDDFEIIDMLQEECAELIQAASKIKRAKRRDPHVDIVKAYANLVEELADVQNMVILASQKLLSPAENAAVCVGESQKMQRYYTRLKERQANNGKKMDG